MGVYYVSPSEQTDLEIDQTRLDENLRERWPTLLFMKSEPVGAFDVERARVA